MRLWKPLEIHNFEEHTAEAILYLLAGGPQLGRYPDASIQGMVFQRQRYYVPRLCLFRSQAPRSFWYKPVGMK